MRLERAHVRGIIDTYVTAWQRQDPDLIVTIFTENATYHERVLGEPIRTRGHPPLLARKGRRQPGADPVPRAQPVSRRRHRNRRVGGALRRQGVYWASEAVGPIPA